MSFRIESFGDDGCRVHWSGLRKGKADGIMMGISAFCKEERSFRMVCEQDGTIVSSHDGQPDGQAPEDAASLSFSTIYDIKDRLTVLEEQVGDLASRGGV